MSELHPLLREYYEEVDPARRYACLKAYMESLEGSPAPADICRVALFNGRHSAPAPRGFLGFLTRSKNSEKKADKGHGNGQRPVPGQPGEIDTFLREILNLMTIYKNAGTFPKKYKKEAEAALTAFRLEDRFAGDRECEEALYMEMRNGIRRYFSTCMDSSYGRKLFGLTISKDQERERLRCFDTWQFSYGIARLMGLEKEMELLCRAANDEYCASVDKVESLDSAFKSFGGKA